MTKQLGAVLVVLALIVATTGASAVGPAAQEMTPQPQPTAEIEPGAMTALRRMGEYLRSLEAFQVDAVVVTEDVLEDGQKVQFHGATNLLARMPDRLRISVENDRQSRLYVYDGKELTMLAPRVNYYATLHAPPSVGALADLLDHKFNVQLPLEDLFRWGGAESGDTDITSAMTIGPSDVDGITCEHYAFRQDGLDWQVWIQLGDHPLPCKLVLTTMTDEARPQYSAVFDWNLAPSFNDAAFTFVPPKDAGRVLLAEAGVGSSSRQSVNRNTNANRNVNQNRNTNINRNIDVDRDVTVNVNRYGHGGYGGCCYDSGWGTAAATATTAAVTAAVGSVVHTLPPACSVVMVNGFTYQQCGSTWYQPKFVGSSTTYVVVHAPR